MDEELRKLIEKLLGGVDGGTDAYDKLVNAVNVLKSKANTEKSLGVKTKKSLDTLQGQLDEVNASLQNIGYDPEADTAIDDFLTGIAKKPKKKKKGNTDDDDNDDFILEDQPAFKKMVKENKRISDLLNTSNEKVAKAAGEKKNNTIQTALTKAFKNDKGNNTHFGVETRIQNLVLTGKLGVNDESKVYWKDPADKDTEIDFDTGMKAYLDTTEVKADLRSTQKGGGGSPAGGGKGDGKETDAERLERIRSKSGGAFSFVK